MRFFTATLVALSALGAAVLAAENPITYPSAGDKIPAGTTVTIKWTPSTSDKTVDLVLRGGDSGNLDTIGPIATQTENDGEYEWTVPEDLPADSTYAIEIKWEGGENYTPQFTIDSDVTAPTTTEDSTTTATASETASETETETATETDTETTTETKTETTTTTEETTTTTEETTTTEAPTTTNLPSTITPAPNSTISTTTTRTTTKPRTTTTEDDEQDNAPDPSAAGLGKVVSSGLVVLVAAAWALML